MFWPHARVFPRLDMQIQQIHVTGGDRGKTRASKSRLVLVCFSWVEKSGANSVANQLQGVITQNQSKREITFNNQLKTALKLLGILSSWRLSGNLLIPSLYESIFGSWNVILTVDPKVRPFK